MTNTARTIQTFHYCSPQAGYFWASYTLYSSFDETLQHWIPKPITNTSFFQSIARATLQSLCESLSKHDRGFPLSELVFLDTWQSSIPQWLSADCMSQCLLYVRPSRSQHGASCHLLPCPLADSQLALSGSEGCPVEELKAFDPGAKVQLRSTILLI